MAIRLGAVVIVVVVATSAVVTLFALVRYSCAQITRFGRVFEPVVVFGHASAISSVLLSRLVAALYANSTTERDDDWRFFTCRWSRSTAFQTDCLVGLLFLGMYSCTYLATRQVTMRYHSRPHLYVGEPFKRKRSRRTNAHRTAFAQWSAPIFENLQWLQRGCTLLLVYTAYIEPVLRPGILDASTKSADVFFGSMSSALALGTIVLHRAGDQRIDVFQVLCCALIVGYVAYLFWYVATADTRMRIPTDTGSCTVAEVSVPAAIVYCSIAVLSVLHSFAWYASCVFMFTSSAHIEAVAHVTRAGTVHHSLYGPLFSVSVVDSYRDDDDTGRSVEQRAEMDVLRFAGRS